MESSNSKEKEKELQHMQLKDMKVHQKSMEIFQELESHLKTLYPINSFSVTHNRLFEIAFCKFFGEEHQNFIKKTFHNLDQLQLQFEKYHFHEVNAKTCLEVLRTNFKNFFASNRVTSSDYLTRLHQGDFKDYTSWEPDTYRSNLLKHLDRLAKCIDKRVLKYGELWMKEGEVKAIKETKKLLNEAIPHEHEIEKKSSRIESKTNSSENALSKSVNETQMQMQEGKVDMGKALDDGSVVTESSGTKSDKHDTSSKSGNGADTEDTFIKLVNDQESLAEVQLTAPYNVVANEPHHSEQSEPIYDTYLLEKVDSNTTPDSTNMSHRGEEID
ncbi:hypothetical protein Tco_1225011 [Tanacetum coccineum]